MGIVSCSVCDKPARARGLCKPHYNRLMAYGYPTAGAPLRGNVQAFFRDVVLTHDKDECLIWPFARSNGYAVISVKRKAKSVCRMVCAERNGPPPSDRHEAAHSCGRGHLGCVSKTHLSWKLPIDNQADRIGHDTHKRGARTWCAKLNKEQAEAILARKGTDSQRSLAREFGVSREAIRNIHDGKSWAWIGEVV